MALQLLLWLCVILLGLVVLFAVLPIHIALSWQNDPVRRATVVLRPFGGIFPAITAFDSTRKRKSGATKGKTKPAKDRTSRRGLRPNIASEAMLLLRRIVGAIHLEALDLDAEFGLGDPADTGQLFGQLCPVIYGAGLCQSVANLRLRPNFDGPCFHGSAAAAFRVTPIAVIWPFAGFGWRVFGPSR